MPNHDITGSRRAVRLPLALLALYLTLLCALALGENGRWRGLIEMANAIDPNALARGWHDALAEPVAAFRTIAWQALIHGPVGILMALAWGRSGRAAVLAAVIAVDVSVAEQVLHWLRPGQVPSLIAPVVAALAAMAAWRLACADRRLQPARRRGQWRFVLRISAFQVLTATAAGIALLGYGLGTMNMTPGQLATFLALHGSGRRPAIADTTGWIASRLEGLDRMNLRADLPPPRWVGADTRRDVPRPAGRLRLVDSIAMLRQTVDQARPGDVVELVPGHYHLTATVRIAEAGSKADPIILRGAGLGLVVIDAGTVEAFKIVAPYWTIENLVVRGRCPEDTGCDHAFHVVGGAVRTEFRNLRLEDFNAHIKINGEGGGFPDDGLIEYVTLIDTHPRRTEVPVTPVDLDAASGWTVADSLIADFAKSGGDQVSYGGYAKAAGSGNVFERNVVLCAWHLRTRSGQRIGLSFGGGGSDRGIRRDLGRSGYEQSGSVMRDNLIAGCSDDGIYINRSPDNLVLHNTLIDTAGIDVRFTESMATIHANLVDGPIRTRDGGLLWGKGNLSTGIWRLFSGQHPLRAAFTNPAALDLRWRGAAPDAVDGGDEPDLCGLSRPADGLSHPGAFGDFSACSAGQ